MASNDAYAMYSAVTAGNKDLIRELVAQGNNPSNGLCEAMQHLPAMMELLISLGANINHRYRSPMMDNGFIRVGPATPLSFAISTKRHAWVSFFLNKGAEVNAPNGQGHTPLMLMISHGFSLESIQNLVNMGANVNAVSREESVFYFALARKDINIINYLLEKGMQADTSNCFSRQRMQALSNSEEGPQILARLAQSGITLEKFQK